MITEFNNAVNGFRVDGVDRIHRLYWNEFVPVDDLIGTYSENVIGSVRIDDTDVLVVDMERIIADMFPDQVIEEVEAETVQKAEALSREYVRIFFAEDSKTIRETVVRALKKIGYKNIQAFENGKKAYEALRSISNQLKIGDPDQIEIPHILLTDIEMPQMDGLTPRHKTKKEMGLKQVLVIMFSGLINEQMILKCEDVGADGYVTKPYQYVGRYA